MAYTIFIDKIPVPLTPPKIDFEIENKNTTVSLISGQDIVIPKHRGLLTISMDIVLPNHRYPFALYPDGNYHKASYYLVKYRHLKEKRKRFQLIIIRERPDGSTIRNSDYTVTLEDLSWSDDADEGVDHPVSLTFKEAPKWGTTVGSIKKKKKASSSGKDKRVVKKKKTRAQKDTSKTTYTVKRRDCLWKIAKKFYGNGSLYPDIKKANSLKSSTIYEGQKLLIPARSGSQ